MDNLKNDHYFVEHKLILMSELIPIGIGWPAEIALCIRMVDDRIEYFSEKMWRSGLGLGKIKLANLGILTLPDDPNELEEKIKNLILEQAAKDSYARLKLISKMKASYLKRLNKFELLCSEIINCAKYIKVWELISRAKEKFGTLKGESFWGWLQLRPLLSMIILDTVKINRDCVGYLKSVIKGLLSDEQYANILASSLLQANLKQVNDIAQTLQTTRNKRVAHLVNVDIEKVSIELGNLYIALSHLLSSLDCISGYLLNPRYILDEEWNWKKGTSSSSSCKTHLDYLCEEDHTLQGCEEILHCSNEEIITIP